MMLGRLSEELARAVEGGSAVAYGGTKARVETIILTGHGSARGRGLCTQLGAFAYLEKPVDTDQLSQVMQQAYDKVRARQG